ncbi:hypothetical protein T01_10823 [Trichinella spiralis]|uniref:Uncharacterized protein n=1 Tax=Trichinella spiralis TaxID=6334 RepID=A0A0V1AVY6_TRISP|nr:hypothetical protein T01_10823 [Trichinella spiralis]
MLKEPIKEQSNSGHVAEILHLESLLGVAIDNAELSGTLEGVFVHLKDILNASADVAQMVKGETILQQVY